MFSVFSLVALNHLRSPVQAICIVRGSIATSAHPISMRFVETMACTRCTGFRDIGVDVTWQVFKVRP